MELWWSPFVVAADVHVEVDNGIATLTGPWVDNRLDVASRESSGR